MTLHFILACHNRKDSTLMSLRSVAKGALSAGVTFDLTVFDDGSNDGTSASILAEFPRAVILDGDGSNFWAKSMAQAESSVLNRSDIGGPGRSYIVWLNDDVILDEDAISRLLESEAAVSRPSIVIGAMRDPVSGVTSYSGLNRKGLHPLSFRIQDPSSSVQRVEAFNGNLVLVPLTVARILNGIDGGYAHALADIDYGLRAAAQGIENVLAPGTFGVCARNAPSAHRSIGAEWRAFTGPKGAGNFSSMRKVLKLTSPRLWPFFLTASYCLWLCKATARAVKYSYTGSK